MKTVCSILRTNITDLTHLHMYETHQEQAEHT